jgi:hypothetical protein
MPPITIPLEELAFLAFDLRIVLLLELQIRNLHFNRAALHICARLKCPHRIFHRESMRHRLPNAAQQPRLHKPFRLWPHARMIPILKPEVHPPRRQPHERETVSRSSRRLRHSPTKPDGVDRSANRRLSVHSSATSGSCRPSLRLPALPTPLAPRRAHAAGRKRLSGREEPRVEVGDDERATAARTQSIVVSPMSPATYERRVAEPQVRTLYGRKCDPERFEERTVLVVEERRELVAPSGCVGDVEAQ